MMPTEELLTLAEELLEFGDVHGSRRAMAQWQAEELREREVGCTACGLRKKCTQVVPWSGPVGGVGVALMAEGPGKDEDRVGRPLFGKSGQKAQRVLREIGYPSVWEELPKLNVVRCRPWVLEESDYGDGMYKKDRRPTAAEIAACNGWLEEELALIDPWLVVAMGDTAAQVLRPGVKIRESHGVVFKIKVGPAMGRWGMVTYHPGATLGDRDQAGEREQMFIGDMQMVAMIHGAYQEFGAHSRQCGKCKELGWKGTEFLEMGIYERLEWEARWRENKAAVEEESLAEVVQGDVRDAPPGAG